MRRIRRFTAKPSHVVRGENDSTLISWWVEQGKVYMHEYVAQPFLTLENTYTVPRMGAMAFQVKETTTFVLVVFGEYGERTERRVQVTVHEPSPTPVPTAMATPRP